VGPLRGDRRRDRLAGAAEGEEAGVALRVDLLAAGAGDRRPQQRAMVVLDARVAVTEPGEEFGRPLDVREQEGDRADRKLGHGAHSVQTGTRKGSGSVAGRPRILTLGLDA